MSGTAPVVTTSAQAANRIPDALLGAAAVGPVAGGWDAERSTFMVARPLTGADGDAYATWSPTADIIAFESTRDGNPEIYTATIDGATSRRLTAFHIGVKTL